MDTVRKSWIRNDDPRRDQMLRDGWKVEVRWEDGEDSILVLVKGEKGGETE